MAAFSGKWFGTWDGTQDHILVVEEITPGGANVIYAWGTAPRWNIMEPEWVRLTGYFESGRLRVVTLGNNVVFYELTSDSTLAAHYNHQWGTSRATLRKFP